MIWLARNAGSTSVRSARLERESLWGAVQELVPESDP
jgi:hypothetical protein